MTDRSGRSALRHARRLAFGAPLLVACVGSGGNPDMADSATCDRGFLCGADVDGDGDGSVSPGEWKDAFSAGDSDGNGQLSQGEFQAAGGNWGGGDRGR